MSPCIGITIQRGILTQGYNSTWNFDPRLLFNVEFWPVYISYTRGIATQEGVKIQQRDQNSTAKEGHNSTKNPLNIDPGSVFNTGRTTLCECIWSFIIIPLSCCFMDVALAIQIRLTSCKASSFRTYKIKMNWAWKVRTRSLPLTNRCLRFRRNKHL